MVAAQDLFDPEFSRIEGALQRLERDRSEVVRDLTETEAREAELRAALETARRTLVAQAAALQQAEAARAEADRRLEQANRDLTVAEAALAASLEDRDSITAALLRLARQPRDMLLLTPGRPADTLRAARLLDGALPSLQARATRMMTSILGLEAASIVHAISQARAMDSMDQLRAQRAELESGLESRAGLLAELNRQRGRLMQQSEAITREVAGLQALMRRLEGDDAAVPTPAPARVLDAQAGLLPATGAVALAYGERQPDGETNRGIVLRTGPGVVVVSPHDGTVRFAGPFEGYGRLLIVEHGEGYHSVLAGLGQLDAQTGDQVFAGEPIGRMAEGDPGELYFEVRRKGRPVDPAALVTALNRNGRG